MATKTPEQQALEQQAAQEKADKAAADKAAKEAEKAAKDAEEAAAAAEAAKREAAAAERAKAEAEAKAAVAAQAAPKAIVELDVVSALIVRDEQTQIPVDVFAHELPVLRAIYGPDFVHVQGERKQKVADFNPETELERLKRKYRVAGANPEGDNFVGRVYRDARELAREAGVRYTGTPARRPAASVQTPARKDKVIGA